MSEEKEEKKPAPATPKAKGKKDEAPDTLWSRRDFFSLAGWASFMASLASPTFKAGKPEDYTVGEVSSKWVPDQRVWVVRDDEKLYAILARCTHLGCTPLWLRSEGKYKCPCHGSGFTMDGMNFEGPAPRPLERLKVDKSKKFLFERGEWGKPGSFLRV